MGFFKRNRTSDLEAVANAPVGARVTVEGTGAVIGGTLVFENAGDRWVEHRFATDDGRQMWVSIENFDRTVATRWDLADPNAVTGGPDVARAGYQGTPFNRSETGTASFVAKGDTGCSENGSVDFVDFSSGDGRRLGFERYGEVGARRRSIAVAGNCPNCGAGLSVDPHGRCEHCGASATVDVGQWGDWEVVIGTDITDALKLA
ncbi:MAG TPA: DUF4178 domain-containing protein [Acidimicrobiales bacterium]|nr:DUF4178 domain-containing protein [Acidimicrobiales bacterium]HRA35857.1 DUF4178 domain-containing protein [Acidimicrobiales bacterium]